MIEALKLLIEIASSISNQISEKIKTNTSVKVKKLKVENGSVDKTEPEENDKKNAINAEEQLKIQTAVLDVAEFITANHTEMCSKDISVLKLLRPCLSSFEKLVQNLKQENLIDYRVLSLFMDNTIGEKRFYPVGPMASIFRKTKSKAFRAVECTWDERERIMEKMLNLVPDKRRQFLTAGRSEIRGYKDMSDQELKAWFTFGLEIHDDDEQ